MRYLEADYQGEEILTGRQGALGLIALNRPRVLNSLSHDMVLAFGKALDAFEAFDLFDQLGPGLGINFTHRAPHHQAGRPQQAPACR